MEKQIIIPYEEYLELVKNSKAENKEDKEDAFIQLKTKYEEIYDRTVQLEKMVIFLMTKNYYTRGQLHIASMKDEDINQDLINISLQAGWKVSFNMYKGGESSSQLSPFNMRRIKEEDLPRTSIRR